MLDNGGEKVGVRSNENPGAVYAVPVMKDFAITQFSRTMSKPKMSFVRIPKSLREFPALPISTRRQNEFVLSEDSTTVLICPTRS